MRAKGGRTTPGPDGIALGALLGQAAAELASLTHLSIDLQHRLGPRLLPADIPPDVAQALQSLDRMTQVMDDLSQLLAVASRFAPDKASVPAAEALTAMRLVELQLRFRPPPARPQTAPAPAEPRQGEDDAIWF